MCYKIYRVLNAIFLNASEHFPKIKCTFIAKFVVIYSAGRVHTLPTVVLRFRTAFQADNAYTIAQRVYGNKLHLPGKCLQECTWQIAQRRFKHILQIQIQLFEPRRKLT